MKPRKPHQIDILSKHEEKFCPRCGAAFECKVGDIANCQCNSANVSPKTAQFLTEGFFDCLCRNCLIDIDKEINRSPGTQSSAKQEI